MIILTSFLSALSFYLVPTIIGSGVFGMADLIWENGILASNRRYLLVSFFVYGSLVLFATGLILSYTFGFFVPNLLPTLLRISTILLLVTSVVVFLFSSHKTVWQNKNILPLLFCISVSILVYSLWQLHSPYPLNWDLYEHQTLANTILQGRFSFVTSYISDTFIFNGYSSLFHFLLATSQLFLPISVLPYWHSISVIHFTLVLLGSFLFAKEVTGNTTIAYLAAIINGFIFESTTVFTTLFFIPQTFTGVCFIFLLTQVISFYKQNKIPPLSLVISGSLFLFLSHYIVGGFAAVIFVATYLLIRFQNTLLLRAKNFSFLMEMGFILVLLLIIVSPFIPLGFLNNGEASYYTFTLWDKFIFMLKNYGFLLLFFLPLGVLAILRRKRLIELFILVVMVCVFSVVLIQLPYVLKFYVVGRFFVHLVMAIGIYHLIYRLRPYMLDRLAFVCLFIALSIIFVANASSWKFFLSYNGEFTHVSQNEIQAAEFLKTRYQSKNTLLVSDPATQYVLEALSRVNTQGGAYANENTRNELNTLSELSTSSEVANHVYNIKDAVLPNSDTRVLALSGRYFLWQKKPKEDKDALFYNIWHPIDLTLEDKKTIANLLSDKTHFSLLYQNPTIALLEVKN
jgi:hypothetical protein